MNQRRIDIPSNVFVYCYDNLNGLDSQYPFNREMLTRTRTNTDRALFSYLAI